MKELDLIRNCQQRDPKAQEMLYTRYADRMFRVGLRYIKSQADAEDVMIVAFSKIFNSIASFSSQGEGSLEGWIRRIVVNESLMWLRRRHNFNMTESLDDNLNEPDLSQLSSLEAKDLLKMIAQLPMGYRTVFNLFEVEGYQHQEIASLLQISENTSRSQLFKAKVMLKKMLAQEGFLYGT